MIRWCYAYYFMVPTADNVQLSFSPRVIVANVKRPPSMSHASDPGKIPNQAFD